MHIKKNNNNNNTKNMNETKNKNIKKTRNIAYLFFHLREVEKLIKKTKGRLIKGKCDGNRLRE